LSLLQDLRFAVRLLIKDRWFTLMAIVALALGIGANNAVFTFVNTVLLRPLPMPKPDQIMWVGTCSRARSTSATKAARRSSTPVRTCRRTCSR
jgi:hypothetical protein